MSDSTRQPTSHPAAASADSITIDIDGHKLACDDPPSWLADPLHAVRRSVRELDEGYAVDREKVALFGLGTTRANGGLRHMIQYLAREQGTAVQWRQFGTSSRLLQQPLVHEDLLNRHLAEAVHRHDRLLVRHDAGRVKPAELVAEIVRAFPDAYMAIVVVSRDKRQQLLYELRQLDVAVEQFDTDHLPRHGARVVLCSLQDAAHDCVELNHRHIVIFPHATEAIGVQCQDLLRTVDARFRIAGFLPYDERVSPYQYDLLAGVFGFHDVGVPLHGYDEMPIDVAWLPFRAGELAVQADTVSTVLRHGVWRHDGRNRLAARLARALRAGRSGDEMSTAFPDLPAEVITNSPATVAVVTATVVHAVELARYLDDWLIVAAPEARLSGLSPEQQARFARATARRTWDTQSCIATLAGLRHLRPDDLDVIVWAGSGPTGPLLPADYLVRRSGTTRRLTLVDLFDHHHPKLREWSELRRRAYRSAEWLDIGADVVEHRVRRFLARRVSR